jgi:hypothetical protein
MAPLGALEDTRWRHWARCERREGAGQARGCRPGTRVQARHEGAGQARAHYRDGGADERRTGPGGSRAALPGGTGQIGGDVGAKMATRATSGRRRSLTGQGPAGLQAAPRLPRACIVAGHAGAAGARPEQYRDRGN